LEKKRTVCVDLNAQKRGTRQRKQTGQIRQGKENKTFQRNDTIEVPKNSVFVGGGPAQQGEGRKKKNLPEGIGKGQKKKLKTLKKKKRGKDRRRERCYRGPVPTVASDGGR